MVTIAKPLSHNSVPHQHLALPYGFFELGNNCARTNAEDEQHTAQFGKFCDLAQRYQSFFHGTRQEKHPLLGPKEGIQYARFACGVRPFLASSAHKKITTGLVMDS